MKIIRSIVQMQTLVRRWQLAGQSIAFVPTMGALHEGHLSLVRAAVKSRGKVVVSIFVNPIQFGPGEDFKKYPRTLREDSALLAGEDVDVIFCPQAKDIFPPGCVTRVVVPELTHTLCGEFRPGHFDGVATVVAKLFGIVQPDIAYFGQKDYQQCKVIERMVCDLNFAVKIQVMPTVREKDGLAMSSRNAYLYPEERELAPEIYRVLCAARQDAQGGRRDAGRIRARALRALERAGITRRDYLEIVDGRTLQPLRRVKEGAIMVIAARIGSTRLIDNMELL